MIRKIKFLIILLIAFLTLSSVPVFGIIDSGTANAEIKILNSQLKEKKKALDEIKTKQEEYSQIIKQHQESKATLESQLAILENRILKSELDIQETELLIDEMNLQIRKLNLDIAATDKTIEGEKLHLSELLKLVYKQNQASTLEILLLNSSLADFLNQVKYLEDTNEEIASSLDELRKYKDNLEKDQQAKVEKNQELLALKEDLIKKKDALEYEKDNKENILVQTASREKEFQSLLEQAKAEQAQASSEIVSLENTVRRKLSALDSSKLEKLDSEFAWPVPKNYITSTFHDPDYPYRKIIGEHPAVDIRAAHGTTLRAAASGYVAKVKFDGSRSYGYIMIIHGDGYSTVYGHVSRVTVAEDDYVLQGQVIGASGGMPGTPGAGYFTTGPHLHFEIRKDGIPVNPLNYLP
ncbi:MAG: peptidoglycan DD-metalloendopeptidase family protein [Candidatus Pacebacteria bacterium]|nr:peptidoglycan DD-metalloendopeptidase family protein [Candidatus Paceibacterota bacterium]